MFRKLINFNHGRFELRRTWECHLDLKLMRGLTEALNIPAPFISELLQHVYSGSCDIQNWNEFTSRVGNEISDRSTIECFDVLLVELGLQLKSWG